MVMATSRSSARAAPDVPQQIEQRALSVVARASRLPAAVVLAGDRVRRRPSAPPSSPGSPPGRSRHMRLAVASSVSPKRHSSDATPAASTMATAIAPARDTAPADLSFPREKARHS